MEHDPDQLLEHRRVASEASIQQGQLKISETRRLMDHLGILLMRLGQPIAPETMTLSVTAPVRGSP